MREYERLFLDTKQEEYVQREGAMKQEKGMGRSELRTVERAGTSDMSYLRILNKAQFYI